MISIVHNPKSNSTPTAASRNTGTCSSLIKYLSKESGLFESCNNFFTNDRNEISKQEAQELIDNNNKGLKANQDKFYMLTINPSEKELKNMIKSIIGREVVDFDELFRFEKEKVYDALCDYSRKAMDNYALSFNRKNISSGNDLVYFGKIETERHYKGYDTDVKKGIAHQGERKPGFQLHVHICVSRNSKSQKVSLSPFGGGSKKNLDNRKQRVGFNKSKWGWLNASDCEIMYGYTDPLHFRHYSDGIIPDSQFARSSTVYRFNHYPYKLDQAAKMEWYFCQLSKAKKTSDIFFKLAPELFYAEKKVIRYANRLYQFIANPKRAVIDMIVRSYISSLQGREL